MNPLRERLAQMKKVAMAATPGPWTRCGDKRGGCKCGLVWSLAIDGVVAKSSVTGDDEETVVPERMIKVNAAHIATFAPDVASALLLVVEAAMDQSEAAEQVFSRQPAVHAKDQREADAWGRAYDSQRVTKIALDALAKALKVPT